MEAEFYDHIHFQLQVVELQQHCGFFGGLFCGLILIVIALHTNYLSFKEVAKPAMHNQALVLPH